MYLLCGKLEQNLHKKEKGREKKNKKKDLGLLITQLIRYIQNF